MVCEIKIVPEKRRLKVCDFSFSVVKLHTYCNDIRGFFHPFSHNFSCVYIHEYVVSDMSLYLPLANPFEISLNHLYIWLRRNPSKKHRRKGYTSTLFVEHFYRAIFIINLSAEERCISNFRLSCKDASDVYGIPFT